MYTEMYSYSYCVHTSFAACTKYPRIYSAASLVASGQEGCPRRTAHGTAGVELLEDETL